MTDLLISLLVFALIFGGALAGAAIRPLLLEHHLHPDSRDVVKMATGLIGTLAALVLGLLIASAKSSFDQKAGQVRQLTATMILLDDLLRSMVQKRSLFEIFCGRAFNRWPITFGMRKQIWTSKLVRFESTAEALAFQNALERLSPTDDVQRSLQSRAVQAFTEGAQTRLLLFAQTGGSIPTPFLVILVFWLSAIFVSFTLFAQTNLVVMASLLVCALSFACAIFLILELDNPFTGLMGISSATFRTVLLPLNL